MSQGAGTSVRDLAQILPAEKVTAMHKFIGTPSLAVSLAASEQEAGSGPRDIEKPKVSSSWLSKSWLAVFAATIVLTSAAQDAKTGDTLPEDGSLTPLVMTPLSVIRWVGSLPEAAGQRVELKFALYQSQTGGPALWTETQPVKVRADGGYSVLLGATTPEGLSPTLFRAGEARWLDVEQITSGLIASSNGTPLVQSANSATRARALLDIVPYAFKSIDAETLGGRLATDYVTHEDVRSGLVCAHPPNIYRESSDPMPAGNGNAGALAVWTSPSTLGSSMLAESGTNVGIGTLTPATMLDVNGASTLRAGVSLQPSAATSASGVDSPPLQLQASTYSLSSNEALAQNFVWQVASIGNNTTVPTANLSLLFGSGTEKPRATGLSIAASGQITFAPGQTFPGVNNGTGTNASSISEVKAGAGLSGGGSTGSVVLGLATPVAMAFGGTGANNSADALANLGACPISGCLMTGPLTLSSNPSGGSASALQAATQNYVDGSQMINLKSLGCKGDGKTDDTACIQTMANHLTNNTYFVPPGTYKLTSCVSIPLATGWYIIGASENGSVFLQTADTCIFKFTKENTNTFAIERIGFNYSTAQSVPITNSTDSVAPAILFAFDTHAGSGAFLFEFAHLAFSNGSRGIDIQKKVNGTPVTNPVWGFHMHDIVGHRSLRGATINLVQGSAQGMPRCGFYNIFNMQTISEPQISIRYCQSLDFRNIESNDANDIVYDLGSNYGGTVSGIHIENHTLLSNNISIINAANSDLIFTQVDLASHICPSGGACSSFALIANCCGGGSADVEGAYQYPYSDSKAGVTSYVLNTKNNTAITAANVQTWRGFTAAMAPGSVTTSGVPGSARPMKETSADQSQGPILNGSESASSRTVKVEIPGSQISSNSCSLAVPVPDPGVRSTSIILWSMASDPTHLAGYESAELEVRAWTTPGYANFRICNRADHPVAAGKMELNLRILQ
jgi:hypothetical protein